MDIIPFTPGKTNEEFRVALGGVTYVFHTRWNARDSIDPDTGEARGAWFFDLYEENLTPVAIGVKVVLGPPLGRAYPNEFFVRHILQVVDTSGEGADAGFDDLGARVQVIHLGPSDFVFEA